ncbi:actin interacting protein 3-domain-containing protein [Parasitella parasitica]|nr:actin interacting protein 3-domain-containing protein [Parasitella parasitica]
MMSDTAMESTQKIPSPMVDIEQSVSKLLMTTKKLLETLTAWSSGTAKDTQVYDEYNALEVHFAGATHAFESMSLPIEDMLYLPDDLYGCLKTTLSKEASSATLEQHLPAIRDTIIKLLGALKKKQSLLRERYDPSNSTTPTSTSTAANSKLSSRAAPRLSPLHTTPLSSNLMPLPSPSSSTEPLRIQQRHSLPRSPISPSIREEFDMNDFKTQDAVNALTRQENLARRSSVRRTSHHLSFNTVDKPHVPDTIDIYIRKGDQVKKSSVHAEIKLEEIRQLFRHQFSFINEQAFDIYILDPASNIEYELEKLNDIKPYSVLSFKGIEKCSHDKSMSKFTKPDLEKLTETQRYVATDVVNDMKSLFDDTMQQVLKQLEKRKYASIPQEKIKEQQKELESLRRDLTSIHQFHNDYKKETEQVIAELREKSSKMTASSTVVILDEKAHAEMTESREVTQKAATLITSRLEALQDTIDQLKLDVTQRRCRPSKNQLDQCKEESDRLKLDMDDLQARIKKFKPIWKKTWEVELQQIVKEQQFLKEQEALVVDLADDYKAVIDFLDQLVKISQIQERKKQLGVEFRVAPLPDEGFEGMASVIKEVSNIHVDHSRRVKALALAESKRSKELSQRIDAFERELTDFVGLRKLKKTGGAQAIDKQRQEKDYAIMKQTFINSCNNVHDKPYPEGESTDQDNAPTSPIGEAKEEAPSKCIET